MRILSADLAPRQAYELLTGVVVPRPIAWVTSRSPEGLLNLAPFSTFTYVSIDPPMVGFNVGRRDGQRKDTASHILANGEFVVHIADASLLVPMHESAAPHPPSVSEAELLGLEWTASDLVSVPRLVAPSVAMECRLDQVIAFGRSGSEFLVGEVLAFHVRDELLVEGRIDSAALNPVCRLAGPRYATLGPITTLRAIETTPEPPVRPSPQA